MADSDKYPVKRTMFPAIFNIWAVQMISVILTFIIMTVFVLVLDAGTAQLIGGIVSIILFAAMLYLDAWKRGRSDNNLMNYGHLKTDRLRGLKIAALSQIPGLIFAILSAIFGYTETWTNSLTVIFKAIYSPFVDIIWLLEQPTYWLRLIVPAIPAAIYFTGYFFGYKELMISDKLYYKNTGKTENPDKKSKH